MQRMTTLVVSVLALSALLCGTAMATENQPPLADAGLDQSVERGTSVQLDANGSRDPDGTVESFEWTIEAPDGTARTPDCLTCAKTTFSPAETGQYNVTVAVTDDDGASRSDTLHVDVVAAGGPSVSVSAPSAVPVGLQRNLTANVTAGDADLRTLAWVVNGTAQNQTRLAGENGSSTITHTFNESGSVSVRAVAYDAAGGRGVANRSIQVAGSSGTGSSAGGNNCPGGSGNYYVDGENMGCTSAAMTIEDTIVDTDGRDGLWLYVDNELTKIIEEENMNKYSEDGYGGTFSEETIDEQKQAAKREQTAQSEASADRRSDDDGSEGRPNGGSTRPNSSVPNNLGGENDGNDDEEYDWSYEDDDASSSGEGDDDSENSNGDDGSSDDDGGGDDDDGGILGGLLGGDSDDNSNDGGEGWFGGDNDDGDGSNDDSTDDNGGGGWSFW
ncbi:PKD domain-containing protein [Haloarcula sp. Atlit-7R]|uniref:PKD domain-containing protein n=1 Tax=Haloarcula sp. Atlit-7R TaxID=2282125 RepID=UPI000EF1654C|nr:PKD domain-containing protein [Haloarcula sp. Atlit-7R]RLM97163.1 PKD domain-containing protein [Haloarcula sp. Atlit-7R]